jgi:hypothetical protein
MSVTRQYRGFWPLHDAVMALPVGNTLCLRWQAMTPGLWYRNYLEAGRVYKNGGKFIRVLQNTAARGSFPSPGGEVALGSILHAPQTQAQKLLLNSPDGYPWGHRPQPQRRCQVHTQRRFLYPAVCRSYSPWFQSYSLPLRSSRSGHRRRRQCRCQVHTCWRFLHLPVDPLEYLQGHRSQSYCLKFHYSS